MEEVVFNPNYDKERQRRLLRLSGGLLALTLSGLAAMGIGDIMDSNLLFSAGTIIAVPSAAAGFFVDRQLLTELPGSD